MDRRLFLPIAAAGVMLVLLTLRTPVQSGALESPRPLPEFHTSEPRDWLNSAPLRTADLRGKVVLVDVWTFGCWNCYRSFPWLKDLEHRLAEENFIVVGVHTPEFEHERVHANIEAKIAEFGLTHPVVVDNDFAYWRALGNRFWPSFYLADKAGRLRYLFIGETHAGDRNAEAIEAAVRRLLSE